MVSQAKKLFLPLQKMDVLFFESDSQMNLDLKQYLAFLQGLKIKRPYRFSFVDGEGPLINTITLKENIYLDSIPTKLSNSKEDELKKILDKLGNQALLELFNKVSSWDLSVHEVSDKERKIAALVKGLLQRCDYIFLNYPEKYLNQSELNLFKRALEFQISTFGQIAFISGPGYEIWRPNCSKVVSRDTSHQFKISPMPSKAILSTQKNLITPTPFNLHLCESQESPENLCESLAENLSDDLNSSHLFFYNHHNKAS